MQVLPQLLRRTQHTLRHRPQQLPGPRLGHVAVGAGKGQQRLRSGPALAAAQGERQDIRRLVRGGGHQVVDRGQADFAFGIVIQQADVVLLFVLL